MNRREFLIRIGGTTVAVPAVLVMTACGGGGGTPDAGGAASFMVASQGNDHVHQITIVCADLDGGGNVTYTSTTASAHNHQVMLTVAELGMIAAGTTVTKMTTTPHTHTWTIIKPTSACT